MRILLTFFTLSILCLSYEITISLDEYQNRVNTQSSKYKTISPLWIAPYNLNGKDMKVAIFDGGKIFNSHIELKDSKLVDKTDNNSSLHATSVAGIILAKGIEKKTRGIANQATLYNYNYKNLDYSSAIKEALKNDIKITNHSYTNIQLSQNIYSKENQKIDELVYKNPTTLAIFAAGNIQKSKKFLIKNITNNSSSKNILTIGALDVKEKKILKISAKGPTNDNRIKPDFAFRGLYLLTLDDTNTSSYYLRRGTSYSTSFVTGMVILISEAYKKKFSHDIDFATLKSILILNAQDVTIKGVDTFSGYGKIDAKKSVNFILDTLYHMKTIKQTIKQNELKSYKFQLDKKQNIKISTCWIDPPALLDAKKSLVNDIDTFIKDANTTYYPYSVDEQTLKVVQTKQNHADNCEFIEKTLKKGSYTLYIKSNKIKNSQKFFTSSNIPIF